MQLTVESEHALGSIAEQIIDFADGQSIWLFYGEMGSGKTTLIKAISASFGVEDTVQSPTFSIVNEYQNSEGELFYHFDFYRIKNETEALDIGIDEYFDSGAYCFVEWPQKIPTLIPDRFLRLELGIISETARVINLEHHDRSS